MQKTWRNIFQKDTQMANRNLKRHSTSYIIGEMQKRSTILPHTCQNDLSKTQEIIRVDENVEKKEHMCTVGGM